MTAAPACDLKVAPTETGCCIRVEGQGTMAQSPTAKDLAVRTLQGDASAAVVIDLSACTYLDSTFLGCLMELYRMFGKVKPPRYFLFSSTDQLKKVLGPTHIDRLIPQVPAIPALRGDWVAVAAGTLERKDQLRHVMDCHRALAEVDGPMKGAFARIAQQIEKELEK